MSWPKRTAERGAGRRARSESEPTPLVEREELRQVLDSRASVLEEARAELRTRAERAESELDQVRAELAELRRRRRRPGAGIARPNRDARAFTRSRSRGLPPSDRAPMDLTRRRFGAVCPRHFRLNQAC